MSKELFKHHYRVFTYFTDGERDPITTLPDAKSDRDAKDEFNKMIDGWKRLDPTMSFIQSVTIYFGQRVIVRWSNER